MKPIARKQELLVKPVGEELVLYDERSFRAHRLDRVASVLWRECDGTRTEADLATCLDDQLGLQDPELRAVRHGLEELALVELLEVGPPAPEPEELATRRDALKAAAFLLPVVTSIVAPTAARAQSFFLPPPPPPPPTPVEIFEKFVGDYEGRANLLEHTFTGFSLRLDANVITQFDSDGVGEAHVETERKTSYDPGKRNYSVTVEEGGSFTGSGSFTDPNGGAASCTIEGHFRNGGNRIRFTETITFSDGQMGTATWEFRVNK